MKAIQTKADTCHTSSRKEKGGVSVLEMLALPLLDV